MTRKTRAAHPVTPRRTEPATATTPDPTAWQRALQLAAGDHRRLRVLDRRTVLVVNPPHEHSTT